MSPSIRDYPGPAIMSPAFLAQAQRLPASPDPDKATAQTVQKMCECIARSSIDPLVKRCAVEAVEQWRGGPMFAATGQDPFQNAGAIAESCWWWAKHQLKFVHHSKLILAWLNERDQLQLLIEPAVLVRMRHMLGDCAIYTMLICAFLDVLKVPWEIVTLAVDPEQPTIFSHVFLRAILPCGRAVALDASHGKYPGWQVPKGRIFRSQAWNQNGEPIMDRGRFTGLHGYEPSRWNWGLGQDDGTDLSAIYDLGSTVDTSSIVDTSAGTSAITSDLLANTNLNEDAETASLSSLQSLATSAGYPSGSTVAPSTSNTTAWAAFATQLAKSGMTLAEINSIPAGTVVSANGQILRQATGYPVTTTGISTTLSTLGSSPVLWLGLGLVAILMLSRSR